MPGWDEASVDDLLADPIVRDLMTADGVDAGELRALLYGIQRTIERYATKQGGPSSLAGFVKLCSTTPSPAPPKPQANRGRFEVRKTRIALADHSRDSNRPRASMLGGETRCTARN